MQEILQKLLDLAAYKLWSHEFLFLRSNEKSIALNVDIHHVNECDMALNIIGTNLTFIKIIRFCFKSNDD